MKLTFSASFHGYLEETKAAAVMSRHKYADRQTDRHVAVVIIRTQAAGVNK